jgi:hypothetical protein
MPNHVINILTIEASNKQEIINAIRGNEVYQCIDFNKIIPMPEELEETTFPVRIVTEEEYNKGNGITQEMKDKLIEKYGHADWYSWRNANWGTKWNAYDQSSDDHGQITFNTAWNTPLSVMKKLSEQYPDATFNVRYADEDLGYNCGEYTIQNGETEWDYIGNQDEQSNEFACEIWGVENEEEDSFDEVSN